MDEREFIPVLWLAKLTAVEKGDFLENLKAIQTAYQVSPDNNKVLENWETPSGFLLFVFF